MAEDVGAVLQVSLLRFLGCTADAAETAEMAGGDDLAFNAAMAAAFNGGRGEASRALIGAVAPGQSRFRRSVMALSALADTDEPARGLAAHCEVAGMLARRLELDERVVAALQAAYERWDGKGYPAALKGEDVPIEIRIATVARDVDILASMGADVRAVLESRNGKSYDPKVVEAFAALGREVPEADWEMLLASDPPPVIYVDDVDSALTVMADFVDLKSPWARGHSRRVADLAAGAARELGMSADEVDQLGRAGLVHDVGRVGVANGVWDKAGALSTDEWEKVRLHPYLTERILSRCPQLSVLGELASNHHERIDGSGYHRRAEADQLGIEARVLAAADVVAALTSKRPHRDAHDLTAAIEHLRAEADNGRLDKSAVESVIAAAGGEAETNVSVNPVGLTDREIEVLRVLCRGNTNREAADLLFISAKTVGRHIENIYAKIGVSSRAAAAVFAMEHRLLD